MNNQQNTINRIAEIFNKSQSGVIIIPSNHSADSVAAATSLYLALIKMGKNINLACSSKVNYDLTASDKFQSSLSTEGDALMISFPYTDGSIDKVDYNIQGEYFNLIITPREGYPKLDPNQVRYSYTGGTIDFIVVIDSSTLNNLGEIYSENQGQFIGKDIINIDRHLTNAYFGTVNYVDKTSSSISELIFKIIENLKVDFDKDIATNLYAGIAFSTNNFTSYSTNANTFETIASLLKKGAIKKTIKKPTSPTNINNNSFIPPSPAIFPAPKKINVSTSAETQPTPIEEVEKEKQPTQQQFEGKKPQNILRPKIFKNTGMI